jgi:hypothetical protein
LNDLNARKLKKAEVAKYAKLLLGCYRAGEAADPEVYTGAIIAVLSDYSLDVVRRVVDPRSGMPSRLQWLPTVAEVKRACEEIDGPMRRAREWDRRAKEQIAERETLFLEDGRARKTHAQVMAALAAAGLREGVSKEQWDAIPNAPERV